MCKKEEACEEVAGPVQRKGSPGPTLVSNSSLCGLRLSFNSSMFQISLLKNKGVGLDSFWELFYCECLQFTIVCLRKRERESVCVYTLSCVWLLCDSMDCSLPVSPVHGVLQARILEWVAIPFSRGSSHYPSISCVSRRIFTTVPPRKPTPSRVYNETRGFTELWD